MIQKLLFTDNIMNYQKGNVVIILLICLLIGAFYYLATLKYQGIREDKAQAEKLLKEKNSLAQNQTSSSPNLPPMPNQPQLSTHQQSVVLNEGEVLNPFDSTVQRNIQTNAQVLSNQPAAAANDVATLNNLVDSPNLILIAPNGKDLPAGTGYLTDYPINNRYGHLNIKINNMQGKSNILVFLYHLRSYDSKPNDSNKKISRAAYVQSGYEFDLSELQSGYYLLEWIDLSTKKAYRNKPFLIYQDNFYAYDRVFNFNNKTNGKSVNSISLQSLGYNK